MIQGNNQQQSEWFPYSPWKNATMYSVTRLEGEIIEYRAYYPRTNNIETTDFYDPTKRLIKQHKWDFDNFPPFREEIFNNITFERPNLQ